VTIVVGCGVLPRLNPKKPARSLERAGLLFAEPARQSRSVLDCGGKRSATPLFGPPTKSERS
jgi:hypothetical protein